MTSMHTYIFSNAFFEHYLLAAILKITLALWQIKKFYWMYYIFCDDSRHRETFFLLSQLEMNEKNIFTYTLIYMYNDDNDTKKKIFFLRFSRCGYIRLLSALIPDGKYVNFLLVNRKCKMLRLASALETIISHNATQPAQIRNNIIYWTLFLNLHHHAVYLIWVRGSEAPQAASYKYKHHCHWWSLDCHAYPSRSIRAPTCFAVGRFISRRVL